MAAHTDLGAFGEQFVADKLRTLGSVAHEAKSDLNFLGCEIEVKTAKPGKINGRGDVGYQFCIYKKGSTDYRKADVLILLAVDVIRLGEINFEKVVGVWVIPTHVLPFQKKIAIRMGLEHSKLGPYFDEWEVIADYIAA